LSLRQTLEGHLQTDEGASQTVAGGLDLYGNRAKNPKGRVERGSHHDVNEFHAACCGSAEKIRHEQQSNSRFWCSQEHKFTRRWRPGISDMQLRGADNTMTVFRNPNS
jgi:hypothetical protein